MNKMNKRSLLSSVMSIAMLASVATGATYALFTSNDDVNITITSGTVAVKANILKDFYVASLNEELRPVNTIGTFATGGTVSFDANGNILLDRIVPGDKVVFDVEVKNESTVNVNFQSVISVIEGIELFSQLNVTVDDLSTEEGAQTFNGFTVYSNWEYLKPTEGNRIVRVSIELPESVGNDYQGLSTKIGYAIKAVQGNAEVTPVNQNENVITVYNESDLRLVAMSVNGGNTLRGKTVELLSDINLNNKTWTPIGTSQTPFYGNFNGNGHTISNLVAGEEGKSNIGLFGFTMDGTIKDFTVENADVEGRFNVGVVAGTPYTTTYENITVKGKVTVDGLAYVGGVFGKNAYADLTNITVNATEDSYVNANSVENGSAYRTYVGGVVGFMGEGNHTVSNVTSNIDVFGSTCDVGGIAGIAHYGNSFVNCTSTGDVTLTAYGEEGYQLEMGGIAGVWHDGESQVTLTNCTYTGTLKAIHENGTVYTGEFKNGGLVGRAYNNAYNKEGKGVLVINDATYVTSYAKAKALVDESKDVHFGANLTANAVKHDNDYGPTAFHHKGGTIDGNGYTLTTKNANGNYGSSISTKGGTIKNLTIGGSFRGIFMCGASADVVIDNVTIDNVCYTFNSDEGNTNYSVTISNSTLNGWTSFSNCHKYVSFDNCNFGQGTGGYQYAFCRPYNPSTFTNCNFEEGYEFDATQTTVKFVNCKVNGVLVTDDNKVTLLGSIAANLVIENN